MFFLPAAPSAFSITFVSFVIGLFSPVNDASSARITADSISNSRISAGTFSPTLSYNIYIYIYNTLTRSPGTRSLAGIILVAPSRMTVAYSGCIFLRASRAFSAFCSCRTPIVAFAIRIAKITNGSTNAVIPSSFLSKYQRLYLGEYF